MINKLNAVRGRFMDLTRHARWLTGVMLMGCTFALAAQPASAAMQDVLLVADGADVKRFQVSDKSEMTSLNNLAGGSLFTSTILDMAINPTDGYLYTLSRDAIRRFDAATGAHVDNYLTDGTQLPGPGGITFDASGNVYVVGDNGSSAGTHADHLIQFTGTAGNTTSKLLVGSRQASGNYASLDDATPTVEIHSGTDFSGFSDVAYNPVDGLLWFTSARDGVTRTFDPSTPDTNTLSDEVTTFGNVARMHLADDGNFYMTANDNKDKLYRFAPSASSVTQLFQDESRSDFDSPLGVAWYDDGTGGTIYATATGPGKVYRFDIVGNSATPQDYLTGLNNPRELLFVSVPEPASALLLLVGGLVLTRRNRTRCA